MDSQRGSRADPVSYTHLDVYKRQSERRPGKGKKGEHMKYSDFRLSKKDEKKYVVIIGGGRLGASLAAEIYGQGNDVCIADRDRDAFRKLDSSYGGLTETGDAADLETLSRASAEKGLVR